MPFAPPPVLGFNTNIRYRGRIFHIQSEDSGVRSPRIMTHVFADGGRVIKSARTDYSSQLGRDDLKDVVRKMMKDQHKAMFIALRSGELDALLEAACGPLPEPRRRRDSGVVPSAPPAAAPPSTVSAPSEVSGESTQAPSPAEHGATEHLASVHPMSVHPVATVQHPTTVHATTELSGATANVAASEPNALPAIGSEASATPLTEFPAGAEQRDRVTRVSDAPSHSITQLPNQAAPNQAAPNQPNQPSQPAPPPTLTLEPPKHTYPVAGNSAPPLDLFAPVNSLLVRKPSSAGTPRELATTPPSGGSPSGVPAAPVHNSVPVSVVPLSGSPEDPGALPRSTPPLRKSVRAQNASKSLNTGRPTSLYATAPTKTAQSIFGEGVMSEQSLDEVILNYLADDLDTPGE